MRSVAAGRREAAFPPLEDVLQRVFGSLAPPRFGELQAGSEAQPARERDLKAIVMGESR